MFSTSKGQRKRETLIKSRFPTKSRIGVTGFEPATSWSQTRRSSQTEPHPAANMLDYYIP